MADITAEVCHRSHRCGSGSVGTGRSIAATSPSVLQVQYAQMDARPFETAQTANRKTGAGSTRRLSSRSFPNLYLTILATA